MQSKSVKLSLSPAAEENRKKFLRAYNHYSCGAENFELGVFVRLANHGTMSLARHAAGPDASGRWRVLNEWADINSQTRGVVIGWKRDCVVCLFDEVIVAVGPWDLRVDSDVFEDVIRETDTALAEDLEQL